MYGRRKLTQFGEPQPVRKSLSPNPDSGKPKETSLPKTHSAPLAVFEAAQDATTEEAIDLYDGELAQLATLLHVWVHARKISDFIESLMDDFVYNPKFLATLDNLSPEEIISNNAKQANLIITMKVIDMVIKELAQSCGITSKDIYSIIAELKDKILQDKIDFSTMLLMRDRKLLETFTDSYRALTEKRRECLDKMMELQIKELPYADCIYLHDWLAYASRPNIPGEELPRLPDKTLLALVNRINHPPKDLGSLCSMITDYFNLATKIVKDVNACGQLLVSFSKDYAELTDAEKKLVEASISKRLKSTHLHDIEHLEEILKFVASKSQDNSNHLFPSEIALVISETLHDHKLGLRLGNILQEVILLAQKNINTDAIFQKFSKDYHKSSASVRTRALAVIINAIKFGISNEDFIQHKIQISMLQYILRNDSVNQCVMEREKYLQKICDEDAALHHASAVMKAKSAPQHAVMFLARDKPAANSNHDSTQCRK